VSLDVGEFFRSDDDEWRVWRSSRRQHRFVEQQCSTRPRRGSPTPWRGSWPPRRARASSRR
jgi:hypothetical protein